MKVSHFDVEITSDNKGLISALWYKVPTLQSFGGKLVATSVSKDTVKWLRKTVEQLNKETPTGKLTIKVTTC